MNAWCLWPRASNNYYFKFPTVQCSTIGNPHISDSNSGLFIAAWHPWLILWPHHIGTFIFICHESTLGMNKFCSASSCISTTILPCGLYFMPIEDKPIGRFEKGMKSVWSYIEGLFHEQACSFQFWTTSFPASHSINYKFFSDVQLFPYY